MIRDVVSKFKALLLGKPRLLFEMQYPNVDDEPKTVQAYKTLLSSFTREHNPIGSTGEQQIMTWKTLKWDPTKEKLDNFVYKFRRVAKELAIMLMKTWMFSVVVSHPTCTYIFKV